MIMQNLTPVILKPYTTTFGIRVEEITVEESEKGDVKLSGMVDGEKVRRVFTAKTDAAYEISKLGGPAAEEESLKYIAEKYLIAGRIKYSLQESFPTGVGLYSVEGTDGLCFLSNENTPAERFVALSDLWSCVWLDSEVLVEGIRIVKAQRQGSLGLNLIDTSTGKPLLPLDVDGISNIVNGFLIVKKGGEFNYFSLSLKDGALSGSLLLDEWCQGARPFNKNGKARFQRSGKEYTVDREGKTLELHPKTPTKGPRL